MSHESSDQHKKLLAQANPKNVTLKMLAEHLGLSRGTVSLVLNSSPGSEAIPAQTRQRVFEGARNLSYKPNYFARALSMKRSFMIGILTTSLAEGYDSSLLSGIELYLKDTEYVYFVASHHWSSDLLRRSIQTLLERGAEGIILINGRTPDMSISVPFIAVGAGDDADGQSRITINNRSGAELVLNHLHALGHRKIAYLMGDVNSLDTRERWEGFEESAGRLGLKMEAKWIIPLRHVDQFTTSGIELGTQAMEELLLRGREFTAVVCFNDMAAIGAIHSLRAHGFDIPSTVSVIGFDDIQLAKAVSPSLTTVRQPLPEMGRLAASQIVQQIESNQSEVRRTLMTPELVVRQSTGVVRADPLF